MAIRIAIVALAVPAALFALLMAVPAIDKTWGTSSFHFNVVSAACLLSAATCLMLVASARSLRETRIVFLALSFFSLAVIFSVHGLTTPGHLYHHVTYSIGQAPWLATLTAALFAAASVTSLPLLVSGSRLRFPLATIGGGVAFAVGYLILGLTDPGWMEGFPTTDEWFQHLLTVVTVGLLLFAAWRYLESYLLARLTSQLAVIVGLVFIAEAQVSLDFGRFMMYSWWLYHALFLIAFVTVLCGWGWELFRAKDVRAIAEAIVMRDALSQVQRGSPAAIISLADEIENHDAETHRHVDRVAGYAYAIGKELGFGPGRLRELVMAAQMHDIGKIGLPAYILQKPEPLSDEEWKLIQQHPAKGYEIVGRIRGLATLSRIVRHHHERFQGGGYPDGVAGDEIPLESRIISVADTYDALTSERPYRRAMGAEEAREELRRVAGSQLDPRCVTAFLAAIEVTDTTAPSPEEVAAPAPPERRGLLGERRRSPRPDPDRAPIERA